MAYINKIIVNGQEVNANQLEGIQDASGHNRFIEGDITIDTNTGVTGVYNKWSLSGTHLMLVVCLKIEDVDLSKGTLLAHAELPEWIMDKIYPLSDNTSIVSIANSVAREFGSSGLIGNYKIELDKNSGQLKFFLFENIEYATDDIIGYHRFQFDLLIDNE